MRSSKPSTGVPTLSKCAACWCGLSIVAKPSEKPYSSVSLLPKRASTSRLVARRNGEPALSRHFSVLVSCASKSGSCSTIRYCDGTMKLCVMRSAAIIGMKACGVKAGMTTQVPPTNSAGNIISQVPLEYSAVVVSARLVSSKPSSMRIRPGPVRARAVRLHDALGQPGGARAVDDVEGIVGAAGERRRRARCGADQRFEVAPAGTGGAEQRHPAVVAHLGGAGAVRFDALAEIRRSEDRDAVAVVEQMGQLLPGEQPRQRHHAGPGGDDAEHHLEHLDAVAHHHRDLVAAADARAVQRVRHPVHIGAEVAPAAAHLAAHHRLALREMARVAGQDVGDQDGSVVEPHGRGWRSVMSRSPAFIWAMRRNDSGLTIRSQNSVRSAAAPLRRIRTIGQTHQLLDVAQRRRHLAGQFVRHRQRVRQGIGAALVHQPLLRGLARLEGAPQQQGFERACAAHHAPHLLRAAGAGQQPDVDLRQPDAVVAGLRIAQITGQRQLVAAAHAGAVDGGNEDARAAFDARQHAVKGRLGHRPLECEAQAAGGHLAAALFEHARRRSGARTHPRHAR